MRPGVTDGVPPGVRVGEGGAGEMEFRVSLGVTLFVCGEGWELGGELLGEGTAWGLGGFGSPRELRGGLGVVVAREEGWGAEFRLGPRTGVAAREVLWLWSAVKRAGGQLLGRARSWG